MKRFLAKNYVYIVFAICTVVMLVRAQFGFCWTDESFYISTADRFYRGDIPLVGEWFRTQMSSVLILPLYAVYMLIAGSNVGVILYFRILYVVFSLIVAIVCYRVLRRDYPDFVALICAVFIMSYSHLSVATFSYYMMSHLFLVLALFLIYDHKNTGSRKELVAAGVITALAVMSMPALAAGYAAVMIPVIAVAVIAKIPGVPENIKRTTQQLQLGRIALFTIIGVAIPAVIFLIYLFSHVDFKYLTGTLPYILTDNEHDNTWGYYIRKPHRSMTDVFGMYTWAVYALCTITFVFQKLLQKHPLREIVIIADTLLFAVMAYLQKNTSVSILGAALAGACAGYLVWNRYPAKVMMGDTGSMFLGGIIVALAYALDCPLILLPVGIVYVIEALSDIIQIGAIKVFHRKVFRMAPVHHHLEMKGWSEKKIVFVFTLISLLGCLNGVLLMQLTLTQ